MQGLKNLQREHQAEIAKWKRIQEHKWHQLRKKYKQDINRYERDQIRWIRINKDAHTRKKNGLDRWYKRQMAQINSQHKAQMKRASRKHEQNVKRIKAKYEPR